MPTYADGYTPNYGTDHGHTPRGATITGFPLSAEALTPSDTTEYPQGLTVWANAAGDVAIEPLMSAVPVTFTVQAGQCVPCLVRRVLATGTTASGLVGLR